MKILPSPVRFCFEWFHILVFIVDHNYFSVVSQNCFNKKLVSFSSKYSNFDENKKESFGAGIIFSIFMVE